MRPTLLNLAILSLTALVIVLGRQTNAMKGEVDRLTELQQSLPPGFLAPAIEVPTAQGDTIRLGKATGQGLIYFVFNTRCPHCGASVPAWKEVQSKIEQSAGFRLLGISLDRPEETRRFLERHRFRVETAILEDPRAQDIHRFRRVPQTLFLDSNGRVIFSRVGRLDSAATVDSILGVLEDFINMTAGRSLSTAESKARLGPLHQ